MKALESSHVSKVLRSARGALVLKQLVEPDHVTANSLREVGLHLPWPRFFEANTADRCKNVDAPWLDPDLQPDSWSLQVSLGEPHQRSAEFDEPLDDLRCVVDARLEAGLRNSRRPNVSFYELSAFHARTASSTKKSINSSYP